MTKSAYKIGIASQKPGRRQWLLALGLAVGCSPLVSKVYRPGSLVPLLGPSAAASAAPDTLRIVGVPGFVTVVMGQELPLNPRLLGPDGQVITQVFSWQSENEEIAIMRDSSLAGLTPGWTVLTVTMGGVVATMNVLVAVDAPMPAEEPGSPTGTPVAGGGFLGGGGGGFVGGVPVTIALSCDDLSLMTARGVNRTCTATLTGSAGPVTWSLVNPVLTNHDPGTGAHSQVLTKADAGNSTTVTSVHDGSVILQASLGTATASVAFNVAQEVAGIRLTPSLITLLRQYSGGLSEAQNETLGAMGQFTAQALDANGNGVERTMPFTWDSSDPASASVDPDTDSRMGKVKALAAVANNLTVTVRASAEGFTSSQTNNLILNYASGDVPVIVIIP